MHKQVVLLLCLVHLVFCQENAGTNVATGLRECYNNSLLVTPDLRPPSTIATLIEILRRIEDRNTNMDARELSVQILQRFRQDGIWKSGGDLDQNVGLPYSPKGLEAFKNKVQLKKLTPGGNIPAFNNESLNALERCSLHFMISSTTDRRQRGDESTVCNALGRYQVREKRETELSAEPLNGFTPSACPREGGVIYTKSGPVNAGLLLAGIAAGLQTLSVPTGTAGLSSDNRYSSTIAGELSEIALQQSSTEKVVGNGGGWNSTIEPKYYYVQSNVKENLVLTDSEIRGGLDGLYLALNMVDWRSKSSKLKISQILDLYYSNRGVFSDEIRACNRNILKTKYAATDKLTTEVKNFNYLLDEESIYSFTPNKESFPTFAQKAVSAFDSYIANLQDPQCTTPSVERVATDVLIFVDTAWDYKIIQPFISYVLENIDVNKYDSQYTILDGVNGGQIVNKTNSILDFHEQYNQSQHDIYTPGFDFNQVMQVSELYFKNKLNNETDLTGQSTILLMIPHKTPSSNELTFARNRRNDEFKKSLPDLRVLVAASGSQSSYNDLVYNPQTDIISIPETSAGDSLKDAASKLITRLQTVPRSVVNPKCTSAFKSAQTETVDVVQYVEPNGINFHKISPHYFANGGDNRNIKIKGQGYGDLTVCYSRTEINSRGNSSTTNCQTVTSNEIVIETKNACSGSVTSCDPYYISVEGKPSTNPTFRCNDAACRFPDNIKYAVTFDNTGCASSAVKLMSTLTFVVLAILALF